MKTVCDRNECTGCGLCVGECPQKCIGMRSLDNLGHLFPVIDASHCIDCGKCRKVCPSISPVDFYVPRTAYAAWAKDCEEYRSSASGGVATVMARHILQRGGAVYGCAMFPGVEVKHIRIEKEEDLPLLKGSKYVQSDISEVFKRINDDADSGRPVLFVGTPCQVAAVKKFFGTQPDNLFLADLVCHGVPSVNLLKNHIGRIMPFRNCRSVVFREGNNFCLKLISGDDRTTVYESYLDTERYKDFYINSFFDGYTYRDCCYNCRFAQSGRIGDITIGDFWGLGKSIPADDIPPHEEGCSLIMPVSTKGVGLVEKVRSLLNIYERPVSEAVANNPQLRAPMRKGPRIILFRALARHTKREWPYYLTICDLPVRMKLKRRIKK